MKTTTIETPRTEELGSQIKNAARRAAQFLINENTNFAVMAIATTIVIVSVACNCSAGIVTGSLIAMWSTLVLGKEFEK